MPQRNIRDVTPDPRSIWRCPCGWEGPLPAYRGHRRGYRKRPECLQDIGRGRGKGVQVWTPDENPLGDTPPFASSGISEDLIAPETFQDQEQPTEAAEDEQETPDGPVSFEYRGLDEVPLGNDWDAEEWARQFNLRRQQGVPPPQNGEVRAPPGGLVPPAMAFSPSPPGDFEAVPSVGPPHLTSTRQNITVPPVLLVIYDVMVNMGWWQGDGSLSALVTDFVLDHFHNTLGLGVYVHRREEIEVDDEERAERQRS